VSGVVVGAGVSAVGVPVYRQSDAMCSPVNLSVRPVHCQSHVDPSHRRARWSDDIPTANSASAQTVSHRPSDCLPAPLGEQLHRSASLYLGSSLHSCHAGDLSVTYRYLL